MKKKISGRCWTCGDEVTVYQILPEERWTMDKLDGDAMGDWVFEQFVPGAPGQAGRFKSLGYEIVVAGSSFGCGSKSVEHPMAALKGAGVRLILADSVSRYSYRNAINLALPVLVCPGITSHIRKGDEVCADLRSGRIVNRTSGETLQASGLGEFALELMDAGGLLELVERERAGRQAAPAWAG